MRVGAVAFLIGILILHALPELPARGWALVLPLLLPAVWVPSLRPAAWALAGFLWALWFASSTVRLPAELEGRDLWVEGWIATLPERQGRAVRFELTVAQARCDGRSEPALNGQRLRLSWWEADGDGEAETADPPDLKVGDRWGLSVRLKRPRGLANPGGFDYERWLRSEGVAATGSVRARPAARLLGKAERYPLDRLRQRIAEQFARALPGNPFTSVLTALAVGEESGISAEQWAVFNRTGTGHLMSVSGSHIGLIAGMAFALAWAVWSRVPALASRWPPARAAALAALAGAGAYTLLSGLAAPAQRSFLMLAVAMLALLFGRAAAPGRILALALWAVLIWDPNAPLLAGFWLSFGAVAAIVYSVGGRWRAGSRFGRSVGLQLSVSLGLLVPTLVLFQQFPLLSPLSNLLAIPWVGCTVLPLSLLALLADPVGPALQGVLLDWAALTMEGLWRILVWLDRGSDALLLYRPTPSWWALALGLAGVALLLAPRGLPGRWLGVPLCLPLLWPPVHAPGPGGFWFTLLDVGQGLAAVVRTQGHALVYDTGPRLGPQLDAGQAALVPFLRQQGLDRVDALLVSHPDPQHAGGVRSLREAMPVGRILTSSLEQTPIDGAEACRAGQAWDWDGVRFQILHPPETGFEGDNASCVLRVEGVSGRVLLPGDIETRAETALVAARSDLAAEVLVAPHHGHRNLSSPAFLRAVNPRYILLATSYRNRFGYPRPETLARYRATGADVLDTAEEGALTFRFEPGQPISLERYRRDARRYWRGP